MRVNKLICLNQENNCSRVRLSRAAILTSHTKSSNFLPPSKASLSRSSYWKTYYTWNRHGTPEKLNFLYQQAPAHNEKNFNLMAFTRGYPLLGFTPEAGVHFVFLRIKSNSHSLHRKQLITWDKPDKKKLEVF